MLTKAAHAVRHVNTIRATLRASLRSALATLRASLRSALAKQAYTIAASASSSPRLRARDARAPPKKDGRSGFEPFAAERPRIIPSSSRFGGALRPQSCCRVCSRPAPVPSPLPPSPPLAYARCPAGGAPPSLCATPFGRAAPLGSVCGSVLASLALRAPKVAYGVPPSLRSSNANAHLSVFGSAVNSRASSLSSKQTPAKYCGGNFVTPMQTCFT